MAPPVPPIHTVAELLAALDCRGPDADGRRAFDAEVWAARGEERTVLVTDLSRFTELTRAHGILHFLHVFRRCQTLCLPIIAQHGGTLLREEADDLIVLFEGPADALRAAVAMQRAARELNRTLELDDQVHLGIGLEHGPLLRFADNAYGDCVNVAYKLGEDVAGPGEVLVGPVLLARLEESKFAWEGCTLGEPRSARAGAVPLPHHVVTVR